MFCFIKKCFVALLVSFLLCFNSAVFATSTNNTTFVEGKDYTVCAENKTSKNEVREFYSYWCGHCYSLQGVFEELKNHLKGKAEFVRNPVGLLGGRMGKMSVSAYAAAKLMGVEDEFNEALFVNIHEKNFIPQNNDDFAAIFGDIGIPSDVYNKEISAFPAVTLASEYDKWTEKSGIEAVPEILINGKYLAKFDNIESVEDFNKLIDYLLTLP